MNLDIGKYKEDVSELCHNVNRQILDAYETVKDINFNIAYEDDLHKDNEYPFVKQFIMKNGVLDFRYSRFEYKSDLERSIYHVNYEGSFYGGWGGGDKIFLTIYKKRHKNIETIRLGEYKIYKSIDKFFEYCSNNYFSEESYIKYLMNILSHLPNEILDAPQKYKGFVDNVEKEHRKFSSDIKSCITTYDKSKDYLSLYENKPEELYRILQKLPKEGQEFVLGILLSKGKFQGNEEFDKKISKEFSDTIAKIARTNIKKVKK